MTQFWLAGLVAAVQFSPGFLRLGQLHKLSVMPWFAGLLPFLQPIVPHPPLHGPVVGHTGQVTGAAPVSYFNLSIKTLCVMVLLALAPTALV
jgi:hypothetical protein